MTLWNPLNVFLNPERRIGSSEPAASFDPSRTGDPVGPGSDRPSIGFGDTQVGAFDSSDEPRRRPIGFAPPVEDTEWRYHTELSFKRHHESPRASATGDRPDGGPQEPWQTPGWGQSDPAPAPGLDFGETDTTPVRDEDDGATRGEEKVPFFKREITFRRKQAMPVDAPESESESEFEGADVFASAGEPAEAAEVVAETPAGHDLDVEPVSETVPPPVVAELDASERVEAEPAADAAIGGEEKVPFFKREITFRSRHAEPTETSEPAGFGSETVAEIDTADAEAEEERPLAAEALGDEKVPFYKREISFRRRSATQGEPVAGAQLRAPEPHDSPSRWDSPAAGVPDEDVKPEEAASAPEVEAPAGRLEPEPSIDWEPNADHAAELDESHADEVAAELGAAAGERAEASHGDSGAADDAGLGNDSNPSESSIPDPVHDEADASVPADPAHDDDLSSGGASAPKTRFSRKDKSVPKTPKRKPVRGGRAGKSGKGRRVVGLKIGASQIAAAVVVEANGGHELVELARRPLAAGIVVDGEVRDLDALSNALKAFFDEENLPKKDVRIGLASNRIGVRMFDVVGIDDETKFDNAVRFKAHEVLPVAAHESVLDYRVLEERPNEAGEPFRRVLLVVAPREQVEPYVEVARRAGIRLSSIDLEALGLLRAFVEPKPFAVRAVDDTATVVVSIGHESSTLLVAGGGACEFTRVFDWGGSALEEAIATALEVHPAEAATILRHLSLSGPGRQFDALDEASRAKALDAVRLRLTPFARELVSSLQFYQTQSESLGIGGIVITGGTSHLEGLGEALHQMIGVNVSVGDPLGRVHHTGDFDAAIEAQLGSMAVPIGLAIDDLAMRGVDLLPKDAVERKSRRASLVAVGLPVAAAVPLVALGFLFLGAHGKVSDRQSELDAVKAQIAALPTPRGPEIDASIVGDEAVRATAVASVLGGRLAWDSVFGDLARVLPANVWLTSLSASLPDAAAGGTAPGAAPAPGPGTSSVQIDGYTYTQPDVARLLARLATLPSLTNVTLSSSAKEPSGTKTFVHFTIVADLRKPGGAS